MADSTTTEFLIQFFVTLIGTGLGLLGAFQYDQYKKKKDDKETAKETLNSIKEELDSMKKESEKYMNDMALWDPAKNDFKGNRPVVTTPAYDSAVNSGNFSLLSKSLQDNISRVYSRVEIIRQYSFQISNFHTSSVYNNPALARREAKKICDNLNCAVDTLISEIQKYNF